MSGLIIIGAVIGAATMLYALFRAKVRRIAVNARSLQSTVQDLTTECAGFRQRLHMNSEIKEQTMLCYDKDLARVASDLGLLLALTKTYVPDISILHRRYDMCTKVIDRIKAERDITDRIIERHAEKRSAA